MQQALAAMDNKGGAADTLRKHLTAAGITTWRDVKKTSLHDFADEVRSTTAPSTTRVIFARAKVFLDRYSECMKLPDDWKAILAAKTARPVRTFLTTEELGRFEVVPTYKPTHEIVKVEALIEAYTGARISDVMNFTEANFSEDGYLTYTSKKTGVTATVPVSEKTKGWIRYAQAHREDEPGTFGRNYIIRSLARKAGINERVKVVTRGKEKEGEKWEFLSSHSFRISAATNLTIAGASLYETMNILGHRDIATTERYVVKTRPQITPKVMAYFLSDNTPKEKEG